MSTNESTERRRIFNLKRSDIETMIAQFAEAEPEEAAKIGEFRGLTPEKLIAFCADNFGMQLQYDGTFEGEDDFKQV